MLPPCPPTQTWFLEGCCVQAHASSPFHPTTECVFRPTTSGTLHLPDTSQDTNNTFNIESSCSDVYFDEFYSNTFDVEVYSNTFDTKSTATLSTPMLESLDFTSVIKSGEARIQKPAIDEENKASSAGIHKTLGWRIRFDRKNGEGQAASSGQFKLHCCPDGWSLLKCFAQKTKPLFLTEVALMFENARSGVSMKGQGCVYQPVLELSEKCVLERCKGSRCMDLNRDIGGCAAPSVDRAVIQKCFLPLRGSWAVLRSAALEGASPPETIFGLGGGRIAEDAFWSEGEVGGEGAVRTDERALRTSSQPSHSPKCVRLPPHPLPSYKLPVRPIGGVRIPIVCSAAFNYKLCSEGPSEMLSVLAGGNERTRCYRTALMSSHLLLLLAHHSRSRSPLWSTFLLGSTACCADRVPSVLPGTKIKLDPGSELGSFNLGSRMMLVQSGISIPSPSSSRLAQCFMSDILGFKASVSSIAARGRGKRVASALAAHYCDPGPIPKWGHASDCGKLGGRCRPIFGGGETGDPRENPPTNGIVRHDSHMRRSGVTRPGIEPGSHWREASRLTAQPPWPQQNGICFNSGRLLAKLPHRMDRCEEFPRANKAAAPRVTYVGLVATPSRNPGAAPTVFPPG
ncbi:hypothetical protein PR048_028686 [Dryococelus australis]|uniref:Uncharacterized protein n=1 Tax=Dryococelus australis TaxID=614101 RepID=A0ABQ9GBB7_9NEOP|nr:hypothetical protein PR048_028686 [Dryococelus australis]